MTPMRRCSLIAALLLVAISAGGCSTVGKLNPFKGKKHQSVAEGERISIILDDENVAVADALKGADFFLPTPAPAADWPLPGRTLEQSTDHLDAAPNLHIAWRKSIGSGSSRGRHVTAPPIASGGKIFVMDAEAKVSAYDAGSGSLIWRTDMRPSENRRDKEAFGGGLAFDGGKVYVSSGYRLVAQLDAGSGAVGWRTRTEQPIHGAPTVAGGRVMAVAIDNTLLTFDVANGEPGWTYQALSEPARILGASSPAVSGDTVVASFGSGELVALRIGNGNDLWSEALSRASRTNALSEIRDIPGRPVIYQGDVYAISHSGVFSATDLRTGQSRWSLPVAGVTTPLPAGDVVYVVAKDGRVICAARETGLVYWIRNLNDGRKFGKAGAFLGVGGKRVIKPVWSSPLLVSNRLLVAGTTGELMVLNPKTGAIERTVKLGARTLIGPISVGNMVYVVTDEGDLIALR